MLLLLMLLSLTAEYLHAGDVEGIRGLVHRAHGTSSTRATRGRVSHMCRLFIHTFLPLSGSHKQSWAGCVTLGHWPTHSLKRDPTMSCQQIIASNHFLGSLFSDKTRDCIQPPPSALMPAIKTESPLHSSLSQLHFYGRNFQRSSSLNLPQFFHLSPSSTRAMMVKICSSRSCVLCVGRRADRRAGG